MSRSSGGICGSCEMLSDVRCVRDGAVRGCSFYRMEGVRGLLGRWSMVEVEAVSAPISPKALSSRRAANTVPIIEDGG